MTYDIINFDFNAHIDNIITLMDNIEHGKITILTGPNGYGKSLLRKLLSSIKTKDNKEIKSASFSMEKRTTSNHDYGALSGLAMDNADDATSNHTAHMTMAVMNQPDRFIIIDEPEVGMGKEVLLGLLLDIQDKIAELKSKNQFHGILIITHSEFLIENFPHDTFLNMEGKTYEQWKNRHIEPIRPTELSNWSHAMWGAIQKRMEEKKNEKSR